MTNEDFQSIVIEELKGLKSGQEYLTGKVETLENGQRQLKEKVDVLDEGQKEIKKDLKSIVEQTANLTEFKEQTNMEIDKLTEELSTIEIITSKNWNDIAKSKLAK